MFNDISWFFLSGIFDGLTDNPVAIVRKNNTIMQSRIGS